MKNLRDNLLFFGFLIVLILILGTMWFRFYVPQKFICLDDGRIIEKENAFGLREMFGDCNTKCKSGDNDCLKICVNLISEIVNSPIQNVTRRN